MEYRYRYMDSWNEFNEPLLPNKKNCYSNLNLENISKFDYKSAMQ